MHFLCTFLETITTEMPPQEVVKAAFDKTVEWLKNVEEDSFNEE